MKFFLIKHEKRNVFPAVSYEKWSIFFYLERKIILINLYLLIFIKLTPQIGYGYRSKIKSP